MTNFNKEKDYSFTQSNEYKSNMSKATKGKGCKTVYDNKSNKTYNSLQDAAEALEMSSSYLSMMLNNKKPNKTNLIWKS